STTILLDVQSDNLALVNRLNWSAYVGFNGAILSYSIYRGFEGEFSGYPVATVASNQRYYYDSISDLLNFNGKICYYVVANEAVNIYSFREKSKSNVVCAIFDPLIFIPTAFTPNGDGLNEVFSPVLSLNEVSNYAILIMNRWGEKVFENQ